MKQAMHFTAEELFYLDQCPRQSAKHSRCRRPTCMLLASWRASGIQLRERRAGASSVLLHNNVTSHVAQLVMHLRSRQTRSQETC